MKIQTVNHKFLQDFVPEIIGHYCNGNLYGLHNFLTERLSISKKEAWQILLGMEICEKDKISIHCELIKLEYPDDKSINYFYNEQTDKIEKYPDLVISQPLQQ